MWLLLGGLSGCALPPQTVALQQAWPDALPSRVLLEQVPFVAQDDHLCGPAALSMVAQAAGVAVTMQSLTSQVYLPGRQGALQVEMLAAARRQGLVAYPLAPRLDALLAQVAAGHPVLVLQNLAVDAAPLWHYAVLIGYDRAQGDVVLHSGVTARQRMRLSVFERTWARADHWALRVTPPAEVPPQADPFVWGQAVAALERVDAAAASLGWSAALKRWPDELRTRRLALLGLGTTAHALGQLELAEQAFERATREQPDFADAWNNLAQVLMEQGDVVAAQAAIARAIALGGPRLPAYRSLQDQITRIRQ